MRTKLPTADEQRAHQALKDKAVLAWAADNKVGTQPPTFPEINRAPTKSTKNIKGKK